MNVPWWYLAPLLAMAWSAAMTAFGVSRAAVGAVILGAIPLGLAARFALDAMVLDPHDIAATYAPMLGTLAALATLLGVLCHAAGRLALLWAIR